MTFFVITVFVAALLISVSSAAFIGAGHVISLLVDLDLFHASLLAIGSTLAFAVVIYVFFFHGPLGGFYNFDEDEYECEECKEKKNSKKNKVKRNDPCPCGSGKKYKNCCALRDSGR